MVCPEGAGQTTSASDDTLSHHCLALSGRNHIALFSAQGRCPRLYCFAPQGRVGRRCSLFHEQRQVLCCLARLGHEPGLCSFAPEARRDAESSI